MEHFYYFIGGVVFGAIVNEILTRLEAKSEKKLKEQQRKFMEDIKKTYKENTDESIDYLKQEKPFAIEDKPSDVLPKLEEEVEVVK